MFSEDIYRYCVNEKMSSTQGASHCRLQTIFYSCNFCNFETRHLILFERHVKRCSSQSAASASNAASQGTLPAPSVCRNYKCSKCSFVSNKAKLFLYHQRQEHGENIAVYGCNECEYASRHKNKVLRHKRLVHKVVSSSDTILALEDQVLLNSPAIENDATVQGTVETTDIPSGSNVADHVETVKQFLVSGQNLQMPSPSSCGRNDERLEADGLDCVLVSDRRVRWIPYSVNAVDGLYQCKFCRYSNPHKWKIASHMRTSHSRKTSYKCSQCNFVTARKIEWCAHKSVHSGKAIYSCGECAYQTTMKRNFERHQERHLVNGPRRCSLCSYSSTGEGAIQRHMAEYHPPSPGKTDANFSEETQLNEEANVPKNCFAQEIPPDDQNSLLQQSSSSAAHQPYCSMAMSVESNCLPTPSISTSVASVLAPSFSFHDQRVRNSFPCQNQHDLSKSAPPRAHEPRWTCSLCPLGYKRAADLNRHMKRKHGTSLKDIKSSGNKSFPNNQTIVTDNATLRSPSDTDNCSSSNQPSLPSSLSVLNMKCASNFAKCSSGNSSSAVMVLVDEPLNLSLKKNDGALNNWVQCEVLDLSMKSQSDRLGNAEVIPNFSCLSSGKMLSTVKGPLVNYSCGEGCRCLVCTKNMQLHIPNHKGDELSILSDAHVRDSITSDSSVADIGLLLDKSSSTGKKVGVIEHCMEKQLQCHFCDYRAFWKTDLKNHLSKHHAAELKQQDGILELLDFTSQLCDSASNDNCDSRTCYEQHCFVDDNKDDLVDYNMNIEVNDTEFMSKTEGSLASLFFKDKRLSICPLPDCKFVSETPSKLKIHLESHDTLKRFMCMHCGKRFSWLWDIRRHVRHSHPGVDMTIRELSDEEANSSESFAEFNSPDERIEGKLRVNILEEGLRCENSQEMSALSSKELHITASPKTDSMDVERLAEQYANEVAAMFYGGNSSSYPESRPTNLVQGLDQVLRTTSAQISVKKKFGRPSKSLLMTRFRPFKCSECGRRSNWRWDLNKHIRTSHPGAHLIELTETEAKITFHEVLHRDFREKQRSTQLEDSSSDGAKFKPYMCNICGYRSNWKCDVSKHIKTLHSFAHIITLSDEQTKTMVTEYDVKYDPLFEVANSDTLLDKGFIPLTSSCVTVDGHKLKRFKCSVCPYRSNFRSDVGRHIRHKHDKRTSRIIVMNENEAAETLKEYMETWARKKFVSSPSKKRSGFNRHHYGQSLLSMAAKDVVDKEEQICMICGFKSKSRNEIIYHWQHRQCKNVTTSLPNFEFHSGFEVRIAKQLSEYLSTENTKGNVSESLDSLQSKRVLNVKSGITTKKLSCNICPYETNRSGLLNIHKMYHHPNGRNKYKCRYCPYFVNSSRLLHQHMCLHLVENNDKSIENSKQNALKAAESFQQGSTLLLSRIRVPVRKTYLCAKCPYTSTNRNDYLYHRQFHRPRNTPSFRCNQCPYWVNQKCLLVQHCKVHRKKFQHRDVTVSTPGPNSKCGLQSRTETDRLQDIEVVLDYSDINSGAIMQSSSRKEAKRVKNTDHEMGREQNIDESCESHYDEVKKAYCCQMCPYSNARRDHLMCHMKFHLNKSSLKCPHCSYSVSRVHLINQHLKVHGLGFPSTQSANVSNEEFAHSIHQKKVRHRTSAKNQLPNDSQTSFVVQLSKKLKTSNLLPSSSNCFDGNSSSNAEQQLKKIFMHKLRLQSSILSGQDNRPSTAADRLCTPGHLMQEDQSIFLLGPVQTLHDLDD